MLNAAVIFFLLAVIAGFIGLNGSIGATAAETAKLLAVVFLLMFIVSLLFTRKS